ncbi:MAG: protein kinase [Planctomycetes bacterium]|nr:protein kinase [Planctomycetota bacterium]
MVSKRANLRVLTGDKMGAEYSLAQVRTIIGRELTCNIVLEEPVLSRRHCSISKENQKYYLTDLGSKNGTYLNGSKVSKQNIDVGDIIRIGNTRLEFSLGEQEEVNKSEFTVKKLEVERDNYSDPLMGKNIKQYKIVEKIGEGGMGAVYKAWDEENEIWTAMKIMSKSAAMEEDQVQRFKREFETGQELIHPNIVQVLDFGEYKDTYYLVMELVEGHGLQEILDLRGRLSPRGALKVAVQVARALEYSYSLNIIHRDIKPDNILITPQGVVKLLDLGLAKKIKETAGAASITQRGEGIGTLHYMAPEQTIDARSADQRADIYSLGATLYHMISGNPPFDADGIWEFVELIQNAQPKPLTEIVDDLNKDIWKVVEKALRKKKENRYQNPTDILKNLERCLSAVPKT